MLWHPEDAQDATQEILIRIVTHLGTFRGESGFITWAYRVAANYLLTARKGRIEAQGYTFARFGEELEEGLSDELPSGEQRTEQSLLLEEVKIGCTLGMLSCLDRPHRLAYILGEILEMDGEEAAGILEIEPATFRKRLCEPTRPVVTRDHPCSDSFAGWRFVPALGLNLGYAVEELRRAVRDEGEESLKTTSVAVALTGGCAPSAMQARRSPVIPERWPNCLTDVSGLLLSRRFFSSSSSVRR
jgi:RNA polymerase sigma factor (sigma-70 family)